MLSKEASGEAKPQRSRASSSNGALDGLPNIRAKSKRGSVDAGSAPPTKKACEFLCGYGNHDMDHLNKQIYMRWMYADGSGKCCWYCERIWQVQLSHRYECRDDYKSKLSHDFECKDQHDTRLRDFIKGRENGRGNQEHRREGGDQNRLLSQLARSPGRLAGCSVSRLVLGSCLWSSDCDIRWWREAHSSLGHEAEQH